MIGFLGRGGDGGEGFDGGGFWGLLEIGDWGLVPWTGVGRVIGSAVEIRVWESEVWGMTDGKDRRQQDVSVWLSMLCW